MLVGTGARLRVLPEIFERLERVPTLVICGDEDRLTPPKYAHFFRERIATSRLALIPEAGHYVQLERPEETTAAIREFLASLPQ